MIFKIGRHEIDFDQVIAVSKRQNLLTRLLPKYFGGWKMSMSQGVTLHLTNEEKFEYDKERIIHEQTLRVMAMAQEAQRTGRLSLAG